MLAGRAAELARHADRAHHPKPLIDSDKSAAPTPQLPLHPPEECRAFLNLGHANAQRVHVKHRHVPGELPAHLNVIVPAVVVPPVRSAEADHPIERIGGSSDGHDSITAGSRCGRASSEITIHMKMVLVTR